MPFLAAVAMVCSGDESLKHHTNPMKVFKAIAFAAVAAFGVATATSVEANQVTNQQWCETNLEYAIDVFNKNANNDSSKIATLTGSVRESKVHSDAFWAGGEYITGCQFRFRTRGNHQALGRFNIERLSSGKIMIGTASWSAN